MRHYVFWIGLLALICFCGFMLYLADDGNFFSGLLNDPEVEVVSFAYENIRGRFDNDGYFFHMKADENGQSRPVLLGKLHSVNINPQGYVSYYLIEDNNGDLRAVKEERRVDSPSMTSRSRMWKVFASEMKELKKQANLKEDENSRFGSISSILWLTLLIIWTAYFFRGVLSKLYQRISELKKPTKD